jgi:6-phosphofructokinase 1
VPVDLVVGEKKVVDVDQFYEVDRLRPKYTTFVDKPLFIMTSS